MASLSAELAARRERVSRIRRRVITGASALFVVLTAAIAVQLTTGHDPALASAAKAQAAPAVKPNPSSSVDPAGPDPRSFDPGSFDPGAASPGSDSSGGTSGQVAPLTTGQS
jgi:hypothetical protein